MAKKSKYEEMMINARHEKLEKEKAAASAAAESDKAQAIKQSELNRLLIEAAAVADEVAKLSISAVVVEEPASPGSLYTTKAQEEAAKNLMKEVLHPESKRAYNIWFDHINRYYHMDVIEYDGMNVLSIKTERLTVSQAMAMSKVQKIFTQKLILRKKGI